MFQVRPPRRGRRAGAGRPARGRRDGGPALSARGVVRIEHAHIPIQTFLVDADVRLVPVALATGGAAHRLRPRPGRRGSRQPARRRLRRDAAGRRGAGRRRRALARFDAVVIGVRAFNTNERLRAAHAALMAYVEAGGTLVVQYNTNNRLAPLSTPHRALAVRDRPEARHRRDRRGDRSSPPKHPALTAPNRDRRRATSTAGSRSAASTSPSNWDPRYETPLAMHDPGEAPLAGSLLWARHGKGTFIYTGPGVLPAAARRACRAPTACSPTCSRPGRAPMAMKLSPAAPRDREQRDAARRMDDAPPFLTWRAIYVIVLGALAAEIAAGRRVTAAAGSAS